MLEFVARTAAALRPAGAARRALQGPRSPARTGAWTCRRSARARCERAAAAGLAGVVVEAGGVMILDLGATVDVADAAGLFLWAREAQPPHA